MRLFFSVQKWGLVGGLVVLAACTWESPKNLWNHFFPHLEDRRSSIHALDSSHPEDSARANQIFLYLLAEELSSEGRSDEAIAIYKKLLAKDTSSSKLYLKLAEEFIRKGDYAEALVYQKQALAYDSNNPETQLGLGLMLAANREYSEALVIFQDLLKQDIEQSDEILSHILDIHSEREDFYLAEKVAKDYLKRFPQSEFAYFRLGRIYRETGRPLEAKKAFEKSLKIDPGYHQAATYLAIAYEESGQEDQALELYESLSHSTNNSMYHRKVAAIYVKKKDYKKALDAYENLLRVEPGDFKTRMYMARLWLELGDFSASESKLRELIKIEPTNHPLALMLGMVLEAQDRHEEALQVYGSIPNDSSSWVETVSMKLQVLQRLNKNEDLKKVALEASRHAATLKDSQQAEALFRTSSYYLGQSKDFESSHRVLSVALDRFPENETFLYKKGILFERQGKHQDGIRLMEKILKNNPEHAGALNYVGYSWAEQGVRLDEAELYIRKALSFAPGDPFITDSLGWVLFKKGRYEEAYKTLKEAYAAQPEESIIADHLGDVLVKMGRLSEARQYYEKALRLGPEKESDRQNLQQKIAQVHNKLPLEERARLQSNEFFCDGLANRLCSGWVYQPKQETRGPASQTP